MPWTRKSLILNKQIQITVLTKEIPSVIIVKYTYKTIIYLIFFELNHK